MVCPNRGILNIPGTFPALPEPSATGRVALGGGAAAEAGDEGALRRLPAADAKALSEAAAR